MKINYLLFCLLMVIGIQISSAQNTNYSALLIPDSLKINANAVVRYKLLDVTIKASNKLTIHHKSVVTVLNELGKRYANLTQWYDKDTKINKLSVKIYNASGEEIKKISQKKFTDVNAVDGGTLYSDDRLKYVSYTPTSYPYTVVFESEIENSSTGFIPEWRPVDSYSLSIEKSVYKLNNPLGLNFKKRESNLEGFKVENKSAENNLYYELTNQVAKKYESEGRSAFHFMPNVKVSLDEFTLKNVKGVATNWKSFGLWMEEELLKGRQVLTEKTKTKIKSLVEQANATTIEEKARVVYEYMQNRTRYIGVQVGIGGWKPIAAAEVDKMGFGDCKGLSNYTKALLEVVGVPSNYTIVYANSRRDIDADFTSLQGNHAILNVPTKGDDIWLECTSQVNPFGFLGTFTEDRNVLVITPEGGVIKRTPTYANESNLQVTLGTIVLNVKGGLTATIKRESKGIQYDEKFRNDSKSIEDLKKHYLTNVWRYNNNLEINSIDINNDKEQVVYKESLEITILDYASIQGNEYVFRVNVFNKYSYIPKRYRNRKTPLEIDYGFLDEDVFEIKIPKGFEVLTLPEIKQTKNKFGTYKVVIKKVDNETLLYKKVFSLNKGVYPKEDYKGYRDFLKEVVKYENLRIVFNKK